MIPLPFFLFGSCMIPHMFGFFSLFIFRPSQFKAQRLHYTFSILDDYARSHGVIVFVCHSESCSQHNGSRTKARRFPLARTPGITAHLKPGRLGGWLYLTKAHELWMNRLLYFFLYPRTAIKQYPGNLRWVRRDGYETF